MKHNLKYLKLFEGLSKEEIPYSYIDAGGNLNIQIPSDIYELPQEYTQLTDEIIGNIYVENNNNINEIFEFENLTNIVNDLIFANNEYLIDIFGFNKLISIGGDLLFDYNVSILTIIGFDNLISIGKDVYIQNNPQFISMSIPGNIIRAVNYSGGYGIECDNDVTFKSPEDFINSPMIVKNMLDLFDYDEYGSGVVKQIIENVNEWGNDDVKYKIHKHLIKYLSQSQLDSAPDRIKHQYNPDYQGTTGRDVAKVNSGEIYGIF